MENPPEHKAPSEVIKDYRRVVAESASYAIEGMDGLLSAADAATKLAEVMLAGYEQFRHGDAPDFMAQSQNARDFAREVRQETEQRYQEANPQLTAEEVSLRVGRMWRVYKNRIGDLRAALALSMDRTPAKFRNRFPQAHETYPDLRPSEAMSQYYRVDLLGPSERDLRDKRIRSLTRKADELHNGRERTALLAEIREIRESMGRPTSSVVDIADTTRKAVRQVGTALTRLDPKKVSRLPAGQKQVLANTLPAQISQLSKLLAAVTETEDS